MISSIFCQYILVLNGTYATTYVTSGVAIVGVNVRLYLTLITAILNVTNSITSVVVNVRIYCTNIFTYVTCSIAITGVNVCCYIVYISTLFANEPMVCSIGGIGLTIGMLGYFTNCTTNITCCVTIVIVNVIRYFTDHTAYVTLGITSVVVLVS